MNGRGIDRAPSSVSDIVSSFINPQIREVDKKAVWGLYCMYAIVGIVYGFVQSYIQNPICLYVFGPLGAPGRATNQQCIVSISITTMPWSFKVFYGLLLDFVGICGTRRKGWIILGWGGALLMMLVLTVMAGNLAETGDFETYTMMQMAISFFYVFSDVAGDGMTIELSKFEPEESRGYILATGQMVRFTSSCFVNVFAILAMDGKSWLSPSMKKDSTAFVMPFELSFAQVHFAIFLICAVLWVLMVCWIQDPPRHPDSHAENHTVRGTFGAIWGVLKTRVMISLIFFSLGNTVFATLLNPAAQIISDIAKPTVLQTSLGTFFGNVLFLAGVWIFRTYFMNKNWRITFAWTSALLALQHIFELVVIYNVGGIGQNGWFYAFGNCILNIIQGISQVLSSLAVVEISPAGHEAAVYEFLTTMFNAGITLSANIQNILVPMFKLNEVAAATYNAATKDEYNSRMANATYCVIVVNVVGTLIFMWLQPKNKAQCKDWLEAPRWKKCGVGALSLVIGIVAMLFALTVSFLSMFPSTNCLKLAGGPGC